MPIYVLRKKEHSRVSRKTCRGAIACIHCGNTGAPEEFVRIAFQTYLPGSDFLASAPNAVSLLNGYIRGERHQDQAQNAYLVLVTIS